MGSPGLPVEGEIGNRVHRASSRYFCNASRARQVGLDRAFRATHRFGGGGHIELLQHAQGEGFALAGGQGAQAGTQPRPGLALFEPVGRAGSLVRPVDRGVFVVVFRGHPEAQPEVAPALQVDDAPAQDAPEQRRPLGGRALAVGQHLHHRVLHGIECIFALAQPVSAKRNARAPMPARKTSSEAGTAASTVVASGDGSMLVLTSTG
jgi:hypothetical protein